MGLISRNGRVAVPLYFLQCVKGVSAVNGKLSSSSSQHNEYSKSKEDFEYCRTPAIDKHVCWIGKYILSLNGTFYETMKRKANPDSNLIILAYVDFSYVEMIINLVESFRQLNITNYVFACSDDNAFQTLKKNDIDSFLYGQNNLDFEHPSSYGSEEFNKKVGIKLKIVTASLMLGFKILVTDVDVVFISNPVPFIPTNDDIMLQDDANGPQGDLCSGFYLALPTSASMELHKRTLDMTMTKSIIDQTALNIVIREMIEASGNTLQVIKLNRDQFVSGKVYFEMGKRMFRGENPCHQVTCMTKLVHNNWIATKSAKIYRFKETGLWSYYHQSYFSNKTKKYLTYSNFFDLSHNNRYMTRDQLNENSAKMRNIIDQDKFALETALTLGQLLNRIVILSNFSCICCDKGKYGLCHFFY